jgi:hypothetical protein
VQPRIAVAVRSAARSRLAAVYSGQGGLDIYTRAISDAYQDLFGEGIFTGKGIYEVGTLHEVLKHRFPCNAILSHDLIEGAYARAGLATDVELVEDYPSHTSAYMRRKHRWVRGDWQIAQWMFSRVPNESAGWVANPISGISRWQIFDNLRRSLVEPSIFVLFIAGWLRLPGGPLVLDHRCAAAAVLSRRRSTCVCACPGVHRGPARDRPGIQFRIFGTRRSWFWSAWSFFLTKLCSPSMPSFAPWFGDS